MNFNTPETFDISNNQHQQAYYEEAFGIRITPHRAHELAPVLIIRPFEEAAIRVPRARVIRFLMGPALPRALRSIVKSGSAPGVVFCGLSKRGQPINPGLTFRFALRSLALAAVFAVIAALGYAVWVCTALAIILMAISVTNAFLVWLRRKVATLKDQTDLDVASELLRRRQVSDLYFFQASDDVWQKAVLEFAQEAALIIADVGRHSSGLEWELKELGSLYPDKFVVWSINSLSKQELAGLPEGVEVRDFPVDPFGTRIEAAIFGALTPRRRKYDAGAARAVLEAELSSEIWASKFWEGIDALTDERLHDAADLLRSAWLDAKDGSALLSIYPGLALLDVLAAIGSPAERMHLLTDLVIQSIPPEQLSPDRLDAINGKSSVSLAGHCVDRTLYMSKQLRNLLKMMDVSSRFPVASWQFRALLRDGITDLLQLDRLFDVAVRSMDPEIILTMDVEKFAERIVSELSEIKPEVSEQLVTYKLAVDSVNLAHSTNDPETEIFAAVLVVEHACFAGYGDYARQACDIALEMTPANHAYRSLLEAFDRQLAKRALNNATGS